MNFWIIFLTGLTTGGFTCVAVQGGLLTSVIVNQKSKEIEDADGNKKAVRKLLPTSFDQLDWLPVTIFVVSKLIAYTLLGALLGLAGSALSLSLGMRLLFQTLTALFMVATAMNLLNVHPIFRYVVLQPPKFIQRMVRNSAKGSAVFTPAVLGFMTIFIPCGVTQAMEVLAITTGSPLLGAATMFAFVLGTSPLFTLIGIATAKLSEIWNQWFLQIAAIVLIVMAAVSINGVLTVVDSPLTAQKIGQAIVSIGAPPKFAALDNPVKIVQGIQKVTITITNSGYSPRHFQVKQGVPVELTLNTNDAYTCATSFTFRKFNVFEQLKPKDSRTVMLTPTEKGKFTFSCSMGMYDGVMEVI